jgi:hypothetical protein
VNLSCEMRQRELLFPLSSCLQNVKYDEEGGSGKYKWIDLGRSTQTPLQLTGVPSLR